VYQRALRLLTIRARGRAELTRALEDRGFGGPAVPPALDRLEREGWLDELAAARSVVRTRAGRYGRRRLERELAARGFSREIAASVLGDLDPEREEKSLARAFERLWRATRGHAPQRRRTRIANALTRRGFPAASVSAMIRRFEARRDSDEVE
jgi:regulatory protein